MSNVVEKYVYFCGDKEYEYVITEQNGVYVATGNGPSVSAQTLTEAKEEIRQRVQTQNS